MQNVGAKPRGKKTIGGYRGEAPKEKKRQASATNFAIQTSRGDAPRGKKSLAFNKRINKKYQATAARIRAQAGIASLFKEKKAGAHAADPIFSKIARAYECAHKGRIINCFIGIRKPAFLTHPHIHRYQRKMNWTHSFHNGI